MTTQSSTSSAVRGGAPSSSSASPDGVPFTQFTDLHEDAINMIGMKVREPSDVFNFMLSCKHVYENKFFETRIPELIENRIGVLKNIDPRKRAAAATQLAVGLGNRLRPIYLDCILDKIEIPDETDLIFLLHKEKKYTAAVVFEKTSDNALIAAAEKELGADEWVHHGITQFLAGVRESFAGNDRLIRRCYDGLWQWYSTNEKQDKLVVNFALELLRTVEPAGNSVKLSVLLSVLESKRMAPQWASSTLLVTALHDVAQQLPVPKGKRSERLFKALGESFSACQAQAILRNQLKLFCPLLAPKPGRYSKAGVAWLVQTIGQASKAGVTVKDIRALVPHTIFLGKGRSYIVNSAIEGNFSHEMLGVKEKV